MNNYQLSLRPEIWCCFTIFMLPLSTALTNVGLVLLLLTSIPRFNWHSKFAWPYLLILALPVIGISIAGKFDLAQIDQLKDYFKVLVAFVLVGTQMKQEWIDQAIMLFIAAMTITLILGTFQHLTDIRIALRDDLSSAAIFHSHIKTNYLMAMAAYLLSTCFQDPRRWYLIGWMAIYGLMFSISRTGYLIWIALAATYVWQQHRDYFLKFIFLLPIAIALVVGFSSSTRERLAKVGVEYEKLQQGQLNTSMGERLSFWFGSYRIIKANPVFGVGLGNFSDSYQPLQKEFALPDTDNPHNEFLNISVQTGLIGLGMFLLALALFTIQTTNTPILAGHIVAFATGCMLNSWMMDFIEGTFFFILSALLLMRSSCKQV